MARKRPAFMFALGPHSRFAAVAAGAFAALSGVRPRVIEACLCEQAHSGWTGPAVRFGVLSLICTHRSGAMAEFAHDASAVSEAWNWLIVHGLLVSANGNNGSNGFCVISRRGRALTTDEDFQQFQGGRCFSQVNVASNDRR